MLLCYQCMFTCFILLTPAALPANSYSDNTLTPNTSNKILVESQQLFLKGEYVKALDLLEPEYRREEINYNYFEGMQSTEDYMSRIYIEANLVGRGFNYFYTLYKQKVSNNTRNRRLEGITLDLAILNKDYVKALEVVIKQKEREDFPGWDIDFARIYSAKGDSDKAINYLKSYLGYDFSDSRSRIITRQEFEPLYSSPTFQTLVSETEATVKESQNRFLKYMEAEIKRQPLKPVDIENIIEIYKNIPDQKTGNKHLPEILEARNKLEPHIKQHKDLLFSLIEKERNSVFYRLELAYALSRLEDQSINEKLANMLKNDNFLGFPYGLSTLTGRITRTSPHVAKPFLFQMLKGSKSGIYMAEPFKNLDWDSSLIRVFGVAEPYYKDELLEIAQNSYSVMSDNATKILIALQEPRLVPIMIRKINSQKNKSKRKELIDILGRLYLPAAKIGLKILAKEAKNINNKEEATFIERLIEKIEEPPNELMPHKGGIKVKNKKVKEIFLNNLELTYGADISFVAKTLFLTVDKSDLEKLYKIRSRILFRYSDEGFDDWRTVSKIISWLNWQD